MEETIQSALTPIAIGALVGVFVIVLVCSQRALKEMPFFCDGPTWILAFCVAMLSVVGLVQFFGSPAESAPGREESKKPGGLLDFVLLPYVVLALSIVFVLLLAAIKRLGDRRRSRRLSELLSSTEAMIRSPAPKTNRAKRANPLTSPQGHRQSLESRN